MTTECKSILLTPWELPADWSKWNFDHIEPITECVRKNSLTCKFLMHCYQTSFMIGLTKDHMTILTNHIWYRRSVVLRGLSKIYDSPRFHHDQYWSVLLAVSGLFFSVLLGVGSRNSWRQSSQSPESVCSQLTHQNRCLLVKKPTNWKVTETKYSVFSRMQVTKVKISWKCPWKEHICCFIQHKMSWNQGTFSKIS